MPYYTTEEPISYIPEPMNIEWEEENNTPSSNNETDGPSRSDTEPTSTSTIQVASTSQMDDKTFPNNYTGSLTKPHTNEPPTEIKIQDCLNDFQLLHSQVQDFKQLLKDMKRIKDEIYAMVLHLDFHIDILLDIKEEHKDLKDIPKLECIKCKQEFCKCFSKRDGSHLGEVALPPCKKKKVTNTNF